MMRLLIFMETPKRYVELGFRLFFRVLFDLGCGSCDFETGEGYNERGIGKFCGILDVTVEFEDEKL